MSLAHISIATMREAAAAWRNSDAKSAFFPFYNRNERVHDKIDDLISEVERLRQDRKEE